MPFQTKNDRLSCPQNEGMNLFSRPHFEALILGNLEPLKIKTSFWGFDPCLWYVSSPHCEDLILSKEPLFNASFWGVDLCLSQLPKIKTSFWGLDPTKATKCRFDRVLTEWSFWPLGDPSCLVDILSTRSPSHRVLILITRWAISKERKVAPKRAQICPDLLHPHGYPPRASKRHTRRSWGHTRELADILSVSYVEAGAPRKSPLTIRRKKYRFDGVFP